MNDIMLTPLMLMALRERARRGQMILTTNPAIIEALVNAVLEFEDILTDICVSCSQSNDLRNGQYLCGGCHLATALARYGVTIPKNPELS